MTFRKTAEFLLPVVAALVLGHAVFKIPADYLAAYAMGCIATGFSCYSHFRRSRKPVGAVPETRAHLEPDSPELESGVPECTEFDAVSLHPNIAAPNIETPGRSKKRKHSPNRHGN